MELLACYRVIRVRATHAEWERASRGMGIEVKAFIRRRLAENKADEYVTITLGESPYQHSLGRSIGYYADFFEKNGEPLIWPESGRQFIADMADDGRRRAS